MRFDPNSINRKMTKLGLKPVRGSIKLDGLQSARIIQDDAPQAQQWCEDHFGDNWIWSSPIQDRYTELYFANTEDALLFKLTFKTA